MDKENLVGAFFKYQHQYVDSKWWVYYKILSEYEDKVIVFKFEKQSSGEIRIKSRDWYLKSKFTQKSHIRISKNVFAEAFGKMMLEIQNLEVEN